MNDHSDASSSVEFRLARLEAYQQEFARGPALDTASAGVSLLALVGGGYAAQLGLGLPNHPYQWAVGALLIFFAYQRHWFRHPATAWPWALAPLNVFAAASLAKLFIGSGRQYPFRWIKYPEFTWVRPGLVPEPQLLWQNFSFGNQEVDLTAVQTFLIGLLVVGRCLRLQGFTSLVAILLMLASLPALVGFRWDWVFPAAALIGIAFYIQSREFRFAKRPH